MVKLLAAPANRLFRLRGSSDQLRAAPVAFSAAANKKLFAQDSGKNGPARKILRAERQIFFAFGWFCRGCGYIRKLFEIFRKAETFIYLPQRRDIRAFICAVLRGNADRRRCADRGKEFRIVCALPAIAQLFAERPRDLLRVGVNAVQTAVLSNKLHGALFADSRHAGDIIGGIAHKRLDIYHFFGRHAVYVRNALRGDDLCFVVGGKQHRDLVRNKLEAVAVAGDDIYLRAAGFELPRKRAEYIVGLVARAFDNL